MLIKTTKLKSLSFFFLCLCSFSGFTLLAQDKKPIESWQYHLPYSSVNSLQIINDEIWCGNDASYLMSYNPNESVLTTYSKLDGFAEASVAKLRYNETYDWMVVAYKNANIDIVKSDKTINLPEIKDKLIPGDKQIYEIHFIDNLAYLATGFGIVVIDLVKEEIKDTYFIGENGTSLNVFSIADDGQNIYAATQNGLYFIDIDDANPSNFANWVLFDETNGLPQTPFVSLEVISNTTYAVTRGVLYSFNGQNWDFVYDSNLENEAAVRRWQIIHISDGNGQLLLTESLIDTTTLSIKGGRVNLLNDDAPTYFDGPFVQRAQEAFMDSNDRIWVAEKFVGLSEIRDGEVLFPKSGNGPPSTNVWSVASTDNGFWIAPASLSRSWSGNGDKSGAYNLDNGNWSNFNPVQDGFIIEDIVQILISPDGNSTYIASYAQGLFVKKGEELIRYDDTTSSLQKTTNDSRIRVSGIAFDETGNLWVSNYGAPEPISVLTPTGEWRSYATDLDLNGGSERANRGLTEIVIDDFGNKWFVVRNVGVMVSDCVDPLNCTDDNFKLFKNVDFLTGIPSNDVNCLVKDLDKEIWVGTEDGLATFFCTNDPIGSDCQFSKPIIAVTEEDGAFVLSEVRINSMAVDAANRKWVATDQGIRVLSEDGKQTLQLFNENNSPLISNVVRDLVFNEKTGEIIIGTNKGVMTYQSDALGGSSVQNEDVLVFPNPIRSDYRGPIAIKGLVLDANVKITDVQGNLVYETTALGSQAIWNGNDYTGHRAETGVYLIFSSDSEGLETFAGKLFFVQ